MVHPRKGPSGWDHGDMGRAGGAVDGVPRAHRVILLPTRRPVVRGAAQQKGL